MQSSEFKFQKLPSSLELNAISPTGYDTYHTKYQDGSPVSTQSRRHLASDLPYEPVQTVPQQWPMNPDNWSISPVYKVVGFIGHFLLTLSPIIFLMLAFAALSVDGQPLSRKGQIVIEAAKVAPSLFPIIFAAVVGRLMRTYALWRAERGSSLGLLEQLNGSQNFLAAVERAFHLKGLGGVGFVIIILWGLSPLGGQSSLRVLSIETSGSSFTSNVTYFNTENYTQSAFGGASALAWSWPTIAAIYQACLLAPVRVVSSSTDLWGNVKIPLMQSLPDYDRAANLEWLNVPETPIYSSLSGIMISGLNRNNTANFTIAPGYINLTCSEPKQFLLDLGGDSNEDFYQDVRRWTGNLTYHSNSSEVLFGNPTMSRDSNIEQWSSFTIDTNWNYTDTSRVNQSEINLIYLSQDSDGLVSGFNCSVGYTHVEAWVNCDGLTCYVAKVRPSKQPHPPPNITPFNQGFINYYGTLISRFPWVTGQQHSAVTSPTDWYIAGNDTPYNPSFGSAEYTNVSAQQVSYRLTALINTFWQTSLTQSSLVQPRSATGNASEPVLAYDSIPSLARMQIVTDVYVANKAWVALTVMISFVMAFCGIAGAVFRYISTAPDILGYVSSMTKDNPYFHESAGSDTLDGLERTRLLQNVVVQIGNVRPWDEKGYIALRNVPAGEDKRSSRISSAYSRANPHDARSQHGVH